MNYQLLNWILLCSVLCVTVQAQSERISCIAALVVEDFFGKDPSVGYVLCTMKNGTTLVFSSEDPAFSEFQTEDEVTADVQEVERKANTSLWCKSPACAGRQHTVVKLVQIKRENSKERKRRYLQEGSRSMIMIRINYKDSKVNYCDETCMRANAWTGSQNTDGMFRESSYGKISFPVTSGKLVTVELNKNVASLQNCPFWDMGIEADAAVREQHNIDPDTFVHRAYYIPENTPGCYFGGVAYIGCSKTHCKSWMRSANGPVLAHELGHNLALQHAGMDQDNDGQQDYGLFGEYGDHSGIMGNSGLWRGVNAPHRVTLGWVEGDHKLHMDGSCSSSRDIKIQSLYHRPEAYDLPGVITFPRPRGGLYTISLRTSIGYDNTMSSTFLNKVQVNYEINPNLISLHVAGLVTGGQFVDGDNIRVFVKTMDRDTATLEVDFCGGNPPPPPPPSPPPSGCSDNHDSCGYWRDVGYCSENSVYHRYMSSNCRQSCGFCDGATTTIAITTTGVTECSDKHSSCEAWTNAGYCREDSIYREYLWRTCPKSCQRCDSDETTIVTTTTDSTCPDLHTSCEAWAQAGYCSSSSVYVEYMRKTCKKSCNLCDGDTTTTAPRTTTPGGECGNFHSYCEYWANLNFCASTSQYKNYMHATCPKACKLCDGGESTTTGPETTSSIICVDRHTSCVSWKNLGYCDRNSRFYSYMFQSCKKSCAFCGEEETTTTMKITTTRTTTGSVFPGNIILTSVTPSPVYTMQKELTIGLFYLTTAQSLNIRILATTTKGALVGKLETSVSQDNLRAQIELKVPISISDVPNGDSLQIKGEILMGTTVMATSNAVVVPVVVGPACIDENANCGHWAYQGHCDTPLYKSFMEHRCKRSCQYCNTEEPVASPPTATTTAPAVKQLVLQDTGNASKYACSQLTWGFRFGNTKVCGESDDMLGGCQAGKDFVFAQQICTSAGARLCSADELQGDVARGTGCGFDKQLVWTTDECVRDDTTKGHRVVLGRSRSETATSPKETCLDSTGLAAVRCCADIQPRGEADGLSLGYMLSEDTTQLDPYDSNYGDTSLGETDLKAPPDIPPKAIVIPPPPEDILAPPLNVDPSFASPTSSSLAQISSLPSTQSTSGNVETNSSKGGNSMPPTAVAIIACVVVFLGALMVVTVFYFKLAQRSRLQEGLVVVEGKLSPNEGINPVITIIDAHDTTDNASNSSDETPPAVPARRQPYKHEALDENVEVLMEEGGSVRVKSIHRSNPMYQHNKGSPQ
eukprot:m.17817 g.17817  ORF g.17817 m.17817 type:complete len:1258 (+) comp6118_c0_seq1:95-3868(+)